MHSFILQCASLPSSSRHDRWFDPRFLHAEMRPTFARSAPICQGIPCRAWWKLTFKGKCRFNSSSSFLCGCFQVNSWTELISFSNVLSYLGPRIGYSARTLTKLVRLVTVFYEEHKKGIISCSQTGLQFFLIFISSYFKLLHFYFNFVEVLAKFIRLVTRLG